MPDYRKVNESDIPSLFEIRIATWGNDHGAEEMDALGITCDSVRELLKGSYAGWIAHVNGKPAGFSMGNSESGEMWVVAVLPEFEGRGIGSELMRLVEEWMFASGRDDIWLTTTVDNHRAIRFYKHLGWEDWKVEDDYFLKKLRPNPYPKVD